MLNRALLAPSLVLLLATSALAQPATRPNAGAPPGPAGRLLEIYRDVLAKLDLTSDQKTKTDATLKDIADKFRAALPELQNASPQERREKLLGVLADSNKEIVEVLTDEQKPKFREGIQEGLKRFRPGGGAGEKPRRGPAEEKPPGKPQPAPAAVPATGVKVGDPAPDLTIKRLDGNPAKLAMSRGKPLVLIFASYTVPTFREKAPKLNELVREYRGRNVDFMLVYTAEAFPTGDKEIDRNKREKIEIPQHKSFVDRQAVARTAQTTLKLDLPIVVDDMDDTAAKTFGLLPNGVAVIGKDGNIAAIQKWEDPFGLKVILDDLQKVNVP